MALPLASWKALRRNNVRWAIVQNAPQSGQPVDAQGSKPHFVALRRRQLFSGCPTTLLEMPVHTAFVNCCWGICATVNMFDPSLHTAGIDRLFKTKNPKQKTPFGRTSMSSSATLLVPDALLPGDAATLPQCNVD